MGPQTDRPEAEYLPTGSAVLDGLLAMDEKQHQGGILIRSEKKLINPIVLVEGAAGTGKTILALQMASAMATVNCDSSKGGEKAALGWKYQVLFYSLEQSIESLRSAAVSFGFGGLSSKEICWDFGDSENPLGPPPPGKLTVCHLTPLPISEREPGNVFEERFEQLQHMLKKVQSNVQNGRRAVFFIDSLNALTTATLGRHEIYRLCQLFRANHVPAIMTAEHYEGADSLRNATVEAARFLADVSIGLRRDRNQGYLQLYLEISKSRLGRQVFGRHLYKIRTKEFSDQSSTVTPPGIVVYQSIHSVLSKAREDADYGKTHTKPAPATTAQLSPTGVATGFCNKPDSVLGYTGCTDQPETRYRICADGVEKSDIPLIIGDKYVDPGACFAIVGPPGTHKLALAMNLATGWLEKPCGLPVRKLLVVEFGGTGRIKFEGVAWFQQRVKERWGQLEPADKVGFLRKSVKWWTTSYKLGENVEPAPVDDGAPPPEAEVLTFQLGELTPEECFHAIDSRIYDKTKNEPSYSAVLLSNTAEMCTGFPALRSDPVFLPSLIDLFQMRGLVSVCIGVEGGGSVSQALDFALQAKADYRISLNHSPDMEYFMRHFGDEGAREEQQVSLVIDNVIGKDYKRTPRWVSVDDNKKTLHCQEEPHGTSNCT